MKSALFEVRTAIKEALQALDIAVYDRGRKVNDYPYAIIGSQTEQQQGAQWEFGLQATIDIEVYNGWQSDYGTRSLSDEIVNKVTGLVTKPHTLVIPGFDMPVFVVDNILNSVDQDAAFTIVTTVIRFRLELFEIEGTLITDDDGNYITDDSGNYLIAG